MPVKRAPQTETKEQQTVSTLYKNDLQTTSLSSYGTHFYSPVQQLRAVVCNSQVRRVK